MCRSLQRECAAAATVAIERNALVHTTKRRRMALPQAQSEVWPRTAVAAVLVVDNVEVEVGKGGELRNKLGHVGEQRAGAQS